MKKEVVIMETVMKLAQITVDFEDSFKTYEIDKHTGIIPLDEAIDRVINYGTMIAWLITATVITAISK